jgi:hypothetical protein
MLLITLSKSLAALSRSFSASERYALTSERQESSVFKLILSPPKTSEKGGFIALHVIIN